MPKPDATTGVIAGDEPGATAAPSLAPASTLDAGHVAPSEPDLDAGIKYLRSTDSGAMRIWTVKGPKETGGTISAVFMQDASKVALLHQLASGKFAIFEKVA